MIPRQRRHRGTTAAAVFIFMVLLLVDTAAQFWLIFVVLAIGAAYWLGRQHGARSQDSTEEEVQAEEVGVSLRWATAKVTKAARSGGNGPVPEDPWASGTPAAPEEEPPPF